MEDKTRPAIDWARPIQTATGERAEVVGEREVERFPSSGVHIRQPVKLVCVYHGEPPDAFGDIYQVSPAGYRLDAQTPELLEKALFIRNVPITIEGWAVVQHYPHRGERGCYRFVGGDIIESEAEAREFKLKAIKECGTGVRLVRVVMTECGE